RMSSTLCLLSLAALSSVIHCHDSIQPMIQKDFQLRLTCARQQLDRTKEKASKSGIASRSKLTTATPLTSKLHSRNKTITNGSTHTSGEFVISSNTCRISKPIASNGSFASSTTSIG